MWRAKDSAFFLERGTVLESLKASQHSMPEAHRRCSVDALMPGTWQKVFFSTRGLLLALEGWKGKKSPARYSHIFNDGRREFAGLQFGRAFHLPVQVISHALLLNRFLKRVDNH